MTTPHDRPRVEWTQAASFEKEGVVVLVNVLPLPRPKFSMEFRFQNPSGRTDRHIPIVAEGTGTVHITSPSSDVLAFLAQQARTFVQKAAQGAEDARIEALQAREQKQIAREKPPQVVKGLKTLGKQDKAVRDAKIVPSS